MTAEPVEPATRQARTRREDRPDIPLPNGRVLRPRFRVAEALGVDEKTLCRRTIETFRIGNLAYVDPDSATVALVGEPVRRNAPPKRRARQAA